MKKRSFGPQDLIPEQESHPFLPQESLNVAANDSVRAARNHHYLTVNAKEALETLFHHATNGRHSGDKALRVETAGGNHWNPFKIVLSSSSQGTNIELASFFSLLETTNEQMGNDEISITSPTLPNQTDYTLETKNPAAFVNLIGLFLKKYKISCLDDVLTHIYPIGTMSVDQLSAAFRTSIQRQGPLPEFEKYALNLLPSCGVYMSLNHAFISACKRHDSLRESHLALFSLDHLASLVVNARGPQKNYTPPYQIH